MEDLKDLAAKLDAALIESTRGKIDNTGWFTSAEYAEALGISTGAASGKLRRLIVAGLVECERREMIRTDGGRQRYPMYREVPAD